MSTRCSIQQSHSITYILLGEERNTRYVYLGDKLREEYVGLSLF